MTPLLRIEGDRAHRYVNGKRVQSALMDPEIHHLKSELEDFRVNGLPPEPEPAPPAPEEIVFDRIAHELETNPPQIILDEEYAA